MNRIQKVNVFKAKNDVILCAATIDGADKLQPRVVSPSQWQRMWIAEDKNEYKKHLAATLFADILQKGQTQEQTTSEKQVEETEVKQETQVSTIRMRKNIESITRKRISKHLLRKRQILGKRRMRLFKEIITLLWKRRKKQRVSRRKRPRTLPS